MLNFNKIKLLAEGDNEEIIDIAQAFINSIAIFKQDYRESILSNDKIKFSYITHKIKGELRFLEIYILVNEINVLRSKFYDDLASGEECENSIKNISQICDQICDTLNKEIVKLGREKIS